MEKIITTVRFNILEDVLIGKLQGYDENNRPIRSLVQVINTAIAYTHHISLRDKQIVSLDRRDEKTRRKHEWNKAGMEFNIGKKRSVLYTAEKTKDKLETLIKKYKFPHKVDAYSYCIRTLIACPSAIDLINKCHIKWAELKTEGTIKVRLQLTIPTEVYNTVVKHASKAGTSLNNYLRVVIEQYLEDI